MGDGARALVPKHLQGITPLDENAFFIS